MSEPAKDFKLENIYQKVFPGSESEIINCLQEHLLKGDAIWVSFVYFAALEMSGWYSKIPEKKYKASLALSDYILADGIAFRLLHFAFFHREIARFRILFQYKKYSRIAVKNLNGTDFLPKLLESFHDKKVRIVMYGTTPNNLPKAIETISKRTNLIVEGAHGYAPFPFELINGEDKVILLVGLGTPRQEQWILEHRNIFQTRGNILVFGVGGLFDFWGGLEKRAPSIMRNFGLEWLWRLITFPRKNFAKAISSSKFFMYLLRK